MPRKTPREHLRKPEERSSLLEILRVSPYLTLTVIPLEHTKAEFTKHSSEIQAAIENTDAVIQEYFRPDCDEPFLEQIEENILYFDGVAKLAHAAQRDVFVLDPAHTFLFYAPGGVEFFGSFFLGTRLIATNKRAKNPENTMQRRQFLQFLTFVLGGAFVANLTSFYTHVVVEGSLKQPSNTIPTYQNFRRVVITRALQNLAKTYEAAGTPKNLALFYPPVHVDGIKDYLTSPQKLERYWDLLAHNPAVDAVLTYTTREYTPKQNGWKLVSSTAIR